MAITKTFGAIHFADEKWIITKISPQVAIRLKALFPRISIVARPPIYLPNTLDICFDLEWFLQRYPMEMSDNDFNKLKIKKKIYEKKVEQLEEILSTEYIPRIVTLKNNQELRTYQSQAVEIVLKNKFLLLGDDLGLGKTVSGIGVLISEGTLPAIIVVPTHLSHHWQEKIREFTDLSTHVIAGTKPYKLPNVDVFIMKYSCLTGWIDVFEHLSLKTVIFEEVHYLRRSDSNRYTAAKELAAHCEIKLGLSATPIFNYGDEIFNILDILSKDCLGDQASFLREWTSNNKNIRDPKALGVYLRDNFMFLRRTPEDVGRQLPSINKIVQNVDFDQRTVRQAETLMNALAFRVLNGSFTEQGQASRELNILARKITGLSKAKAVAEYVKILLDNNRPVLLVGWHIDVYEIWKKELKEYNPVFYTGSVKAGEKDENANLFKSLKTKLIIFSLASGEGLDGLQFVCSDIVFGELGWNDATHNQLIGRLHRDGQVNQVTAHFLVSDSGSDPLIIELLGLKASESRRIIDPGHDIKQIESDDSRMKMLAKVILKQNISES
jgi:SNF2 family DNA or RNA helicase